MADTYKVIFAAQLGNAADPAVLYTPGVGKQAILKNIGLRNIGANVESVSFLVNGNTTSKGWGPIIKLQAAGVDGCCAEWDGTLPLANADALYANTTDLTAVVCIITGDELS